MSASGNRPGDETDETSAPQSVRSFLRGYLRFLYVLRRPLAVVLVGVVLLALVATFGLRLFAIFQGPALLFVLGVVLIVAFFAWLTVLRREMQKISYARLFDDR